MVDTEKNTLRECLPAWLREHGFPLTRSFRCLNPAHQDRHPSMRYNPKNQTVHCFSCGATYDLFDLLGMEEGLDGFSAQLEAARRRYGGMTSQVSVYREKTGVDLTVYAREGAQKRTEADLVWFEARGIGQALVEKYGLFVDGGRAVFPLWEAGCCVGWCARAMEDSLRPRYRNSPGPMGIWGVDSLYDSAGQPVAVCEGVMDALSLESCGCRAVALCGAANSRRLLQVLRRLEGPVPPLILAGDDDEAGRKMNRELADGLRELGVNCVLLRYPEGCADANDALVRCKERLEQEVERALREAEGGQALEKERYEESSLAGMAGEFLAYLDRSRQRAAFSSGICALDEALGGGIFPGLYVLGAPSSLGKTTLLLQMADAMAAAGQDVLFYSMEMSRWELLAKSLSRRAGLRQSAAMRQILQDSLDRDRLERMLDEYNRECGCRFFIVDGAAFTPEQLVQKAREHRERRGTAPVVFVDYLQILAPSDPRASDKQNVDRAVLWLKTLSRELDTPVIAASSFNRESYGKGASMEAFKESGAVEYAADVLLALQLSAFGREGFDQDKEKAAEPRKEDLLILKNRNGAAFGRIPLRYHAVSNLFVQEERPAAAPEKGPRVNRIGRKK